MAHMRQEPSKHEFISKKDDGKPFFDIIAGTSIGAINAAILVGHAIENNNNWEGSDERLIGFWKDIASWDILGSPVFREFNKWWANWRSSLRSIPFAKIAPPEAARRYPANFVV